MNHKTQKIGPSRVSPRFFFLILRDHDTPPKNTNCSTTNRDCSVRSQNRLFFGVLARRKVLQIILLHGTIFDDISTSSIHGRLHFSSSKSYLATHITSKWSSTIKHTLWPGKQKSWAGLCSCSCQRPGRHLCLSVAFRSTWRSPLSRSRPWIPFWRYSFSDWQYNFSVAQDVEDGAN